MEAEGEEDSPTSNKMSDSKGEEDARPSRAGPSKPPTSSEPASHQAKARQRRREKPSAEAAGPQNSSDEQRKYPRMTISIDNPQPSSSSTAKNGASKGSNTPLVVNVVEGKDREEGEICSSDDENKVGEELGQVEKVSSGGASSGDASSDDEEEKKERSSDDDSSRENSSEEDNGSSRSGE